MAEMGVNWGSMAQAAAERSAASAHTASFGRLATTCDFHAGTPDGTVKADQWSPIGGRRPIRSPALNHHACMGGHITSPCLRPRVSSPTEPFVLELPVRICNLQWPASICIMVCFRVFQPCATYARVALDWISHFSERDRLQLLDGRVVGERQSREHTQAMCTRPHTPSH